MQTDLVQKLCLYILNQNRTQAAIILKRHFFKKKPSNLNQTDIIGHTPVIKCVMTNAFSLLKKIHKMGGCINKPTRIKRLSPLHIACYNGYPHIVEFLLEKGAKINAQDTSGNTPLHSACAKNQLACVRLLVGKEVKTKTRNNSKKMAVQLTKHVEIKAILDPLCGRRVNFKKNNISHWSLKNTKKTSVGDIKDGKLTPPKNDKIEWKIVSKIGRGSFGDVYLAIDLKTKKLIAIKKIPIDERSSNMHKIVKEIKFYRTLSHKNVVKYLGCEKRSIELDDFFYIYLEYCSEGNLFEFFCKIEDIQKRVFFLQFYLKQIAEGLTYLHDNNIIHRDIKPRNVLIHTKNEIKLTDFGSAKEVEQTMMSNTMTSSEGTFFFLPPEILQQKSKRKFKILPKALDMWSLGITILNLLVGDNIYPKESFQSPFMLIPYIANLEKPPDIPKSIKNVTLRDLISKLLKLNPAERISAKGVLDHKFFLEKLDCVADDDEINNEESEEFG